MRSLVLNLPDHVYADAERAATAHGYPDMEAYVADLIAYDAEGDAPLSPESLRIIEQARKDIAEGKGLTLEEIRADREIQRAEWLRANPQ